MRSLPPMVDMALSPQEIEEEKEPCTDMPVPKYPWGLCLRLTQDELDKLNLDAADVSVGDVVHLFAFAKVTSVSTNSTDEGDRSCVELQIIAIASEDEDEENAEADQQLRAPAFHALYGE